MNKGELIASISVQAGVSKHTAKIMLDTMFDGIIKNVSRDKNVGLAGLGSFTLTKRKARVGRNPKTGAALQIPAKKVIKFKPYTNVLKALNPELYKIKK